MPNMASHLGRLAALVAALVLASSAPSVSAAPAAPSDAYAASLHWRNVGPLRAGRSLAVTGVPGDPYHFYMGSVDGGVWATANAGRTWTPIFDGQPVASIGAIAVAPSDPATIYVGTGEADMRSDIVHGGGMFVSHDAGATWTRIGLEATRNIGRIIVDPHDAKTVYVAALGHAFGPNVERGVFKSTDGGATWTAILQKDANTGAIDLAFDPSDPKTIYASLWQTRRPPWEVYPPSNGPGSGLYKSTDAGATWKPLANGLPTAGLGKIGIGVALSDPKRVYAIVDAKDGGLYRSDDAGATFAKIDDEKRIWTRGWYFEHVIVDPKNADRVYVSNTSVYRSDDAGKSFTAIKGAPGGDDYHQLWIDPTAPERMILASDQGTIVSVDGAKTWSSWYNQSTAQIYHIAADDRFPYWLYGAQQDSGAAAVPSRSFHRSISARDWRPINAGGESDEIVADPAHPGTIFGGRVDREDLATGTTRSVAEDNAEEHDERANWTLPLVRSQADPKALYASHARIYRSRDGGNSWQTVSPDLTRATYPVPANLDAPTAADADDTNPRRGVVYAIAPSPILTARLWAGTDDGLIWTSGDAGRTWSNVTPPSMGPWSTVSSLDASHFDAGTAYAAINRHRLDDDTPIVLRTRNYGKTWETIVNGLPATDPVNVVRGDRHRRGLLFAGTESGVSVSFDDGASWKPLQRNLPSVSVRDLIVHQSDLAIATHGRGFWIMDDIRPLRAYKPELETTSYLVAPRPTIRVRPGDDEGTPLPPEETLLENPPTGAMLDYQLASTTTGPIAITIATANGAVIRRYASDDPVVPVDPTKLDIPAFWVVPAQPPAATPGFHRFVWDLHTQPIGVRTRRGGDVGPWVPPGTYVVRLTAGGKTVTQNLVIRRDPRIAATDADLQTQYAFSTAVATLRIHANDALAKTTDAARKTKLQALRDAAGALYASTQSGDDAPTATERHEFTVLQARAKALNIG